MMVFVICHFIFFGYIQVLGVMFYAFVPENSFKPFLYLIIAFVYLCLDTFIYYLNYKRKGKSKFAKALFVYDTVIFFIMSLVYTVFYIMNFVLYIVFLIARNDSQEGHQKR